MLEFVCFSDLDTDSRRNILKHLEISTDFVGVDLLEQAKTFAIDALVEPWTLYLKYDVKLFLE